METNTYPLVPLENLSEIHDSKRIPVKKSDRKPGPYPYYGASGIVDYVDSYIFDGEFLLLAEDGENLRSQKLPIASLVKGKFWVNNHAHVLQGKKGNNTRFLCYALQVADIRSYLSGSTRPKLTQADMKRILVPAPDSREQRAIAHILGTLDDKIELNRRMNRTLETMAQALFKSWFIDFDPVVVNALRAGNPVPDKFAKRAAHYHDNPDALRLPEDILRRFPDRFQDSELGPTPEGWGIKKIGELLELAYGKALPKKSRRPGPYPVYGSGGIGGFHSEYLTEGPGIIVGRKGTVGSVYWEDEDFFPIDTVFYVKTKKLIPLYWVYLMLCRMDIKGMGADSAVPGVNRNAVYAHEWILPTTPALDLFRDFVQTTINKLQENRKESDTLVSLRDTLLPKLISGELRVPDAEKLVEDIL